MNLYGPMLLVDKDSRKVIANGMDADSSLRSIQNVFVGAWPEDMAVANTAIEWGGKKWTMVMWPLPESRYDRNALIAHELWHRVQGDIGLPMQGGATMHLGSRDGRYWLQMEWRALAKALGQGISRNDATPANTNGMMDDGMKRQAVSDALAFRAYRRSLFKGAAEAERKLEMHEGLAQYTGLVLSGRSAGLGREKAAWDLKRAESNATFVRSFAYASGPAYGLLMDAAAEGFAQRSTAKESWRSDVKSGSDLGVLLAEAYGVRIPKDLASYVREAAERYDNAELVQREDRLEAERQERLADLRRKFVTGPVLELPFRKMQVSFDPGKVDVLDDAGTIYLSMQLSDEWGILKATNGALITKTWSMAVVPAPPDTAGPHIEGEGYTLTLNEGWALKKLQTRQGYRIGRQ